MVGKGKVKILRNRQRTIRLPKPWAESFQWKDGDKILVTAGKRYMRAIVQSHKKSHLSLSQDVIEYLLLPPVPLSWKVEKDRIRFGPFVAAYAIYSERLKDPFSSNTGVFQDMTKLANDLHVPFYVISAGGLDHENKLALSWLFDSRTGYWRQRPCPWPDFFIRKNIYTPVKWKKVIEQEAAWLEMDHGEMLSRTIGSKWDVYRMISDDPDLTSYLPHTNRIQTVRDIFRLLKRFPVVYVKPVWGMQGKHVYRVSRKSLGKIQIEFQVADQIRSLQFNVAKSRGWMSRRFLGQSGYLVQQGIDLIQDEYGRTADFRWLIQKNGEGIWSVTARVARVARKGWLTTNVSTGGDAVDAYDFLRLAGFRGDEITKSIQQMDDLSLQIVNRLENKVGSMGELGIDFGLDKTGHPWLIEVNPRPGRKMLKMLDQKLRELSLRRPLEYAKYTVGFSDRSIF
jgi:bifunctional DNA-binding transcriptional regulator/antitoxin component of YhaV-PrlF toxin-antitoxin module